MFYQGLQNFYNEYKDYINLSLIEKMDRWLAFLNEDEQKNINPYKMADDIKIKVEIIQEILDKLSKRDFLKKKFLIRCESCGHILAECYEEEFYDKSIEVLSKRTCYNCDEEISELKEEDIELRYEVKERMDNNPKKIKKDMKILLDNNESNEIKNTLDKANYDSDELFFKPTEEKKEELSRLFCGINDAKGRGAKGRAMEEFVVYLFNCVRGVNATRKCTTDTNQIDIYAKNKSPYKNGVIDRMGEFIIGECKNEAHSPENGYFYKLVGVIEKDRGYSKEKRLGILFSKEKAPNTFSKMARETFLKKNITIITFYYDELQEIVDGKANFLGYIDYKMRIVEGALTEKDEVKKIFI